MEQVVPMMPIIANWASNWLPNDSRVSELHCLFCHRSERSLHLNAGLLLLSGSNMKIDHFTIDDGCENLSAAYNKYASSNCF